MKSFSFTEHLHFFSESHVSPSFRQSASVWHSVERNTLFKWRSLGSGTTWKNIRFNIIRSVQDEISGDHISHPSEAHKGYRIFKYSVDDPFTEKREKYIVFQPSDDTCLSIICSRGACFPMILVMRKCVRTYTASEGSDQLCHIGFEAEYFDKT